MEEELPTALEVLICSKCMLSSFFTSAGVGRTGTYLAIDMQLKKAQLSQPEIDVFTCVQAMRSRRQNMVQTLVRKSAVCILGTLSICLLPAAFLTLFLTF